jgi:Uma2 family endonuclease
MSLRARLSDEGHPDKMASQADMANALEYPRRSKRGEHVWEPAALYREQGYWNEVAYLALETNLLIEYRDGMLEFLPMPTRAHLTVVWLFTPLIDAWIRKHGGHVFEPPMRLRLAPEPYRKPHLMVVLHPGTYTVSESFLTRTDVVMEVVSESEENHRRDYETESAECAQAGIPVYWIVDSIGKCVTVVILKDGTYHEHSNATSGETATFAVLPGFTVTAGQLFSTGAKSV